MWVARGKIEVPGVKPIAAFRRWKAGSIRRRILFWPVALTLFCGSIELAMPLDRFLENMRDAVRSRAADGSIVIVKVDDRSIKALSWPNRRATDGETTDALFALGARRVVFDRAFADPSPVGDDALFVNALKQHRGRVIVGGRFEEDHDTGVRSPILPIAPIREVAEIGSYSVRRDVIGYTSGIPYASEIDGARYPSFAAILAGRGGGVDELFEPDYAIEYRTIPTVSLLDVVRRAPEAAVVAGKDVIIGPTADTLGDTHMIPRQGPIPGVYIHAIAAETLRRATPVEAGWVPFYAVALALSFAYVSTRRRRQRLALAMTGYATIAALPVLLDAGNIEVEIVPALLLLGSVMVRAKLLARRTINPATGLPTLDPEHHQVATSPATLVGVKLRNYSDLRLTLSDQEERELLAEVVRRLRVTGDESELMHVDDTFVWRSGLKVSSTLIDHIEGLYAVLSTPIEVGNRRVDLSFAFGVDGEIDRPLSNRIGGVQLSADRAAAAGAKWKVNDPRVAGDADFRLSLPSRIEHAIGTGEIWVAYQPKMDLDGKQICGAEALVRWTHPERGAIRPDEFIPAVEEANRIEGLTYFVLETAIRDTCSLDRLAPGFTVAVNLSGRMLDAPGLSARVLELLGRYGLAPQRLTLELTESFQINADSGALVALKQLRAAGVAISIDDYGTKFSTLEYVRQLPATEIKIDQQFARNVHRDAQDAIMVGSTIKLAHDLGLKVVAEGVEEPHAYAKLAELGCDVVQGYIISKPQPIDEIKKLLGFIDTHQEPKSYRLANQR